MPSVNRVILIGNITKDIELRYTPKGTAVCELNLAINRVSKDANGNKVEEVTFVSVTCWSKIAEIVAEYCRKGSPLYIEGRLSNESWDDRETGKKMHKTKVVAENIQFLGKKPQGESSQQRPVPPPKRPTVDPDLEPDDQDIPF